MRPHFLLFIGIACLFCMASCHSHPSPEPVEEEIVNDTVVECDTLSVDHLCEFDSLIKVEAERIGWDWRMLASIIYQESRFNPDLVNEKGAYGLMQLMPIVMERYGIDYNSSIGEQLEAAGNLLMYFDSQLPETISDSLERGYFILACYNAGLGSIQNARVRTALKGKNPDLWFHNVENCSPRQTYWFVREIIERYNMYQTMIQ